MDAFHEDAGMVIRGRYNRAEDRWVIHEFSLNDGGDLVPLGHHIVADQALMLGNIQSGLESVKIFGPDNPRLVR